MKMKIKLIQPLPKKIKKENALNIWREYKRRGSFKNSNVATVHPIHSWNSVDSPS